MTHASVPEKDREVLGISDTLIRLSVGLEDEADIIEDIQQALDAAVSNISNKTHYFSGKHYHRGHRLHFNMEMFVFSTLTLTAAQQKISTTVRFTL